MGKPYSLDLRERICAYVGQGYSARAAGRVVGVGAATAVRFAAQYRHRGDMAPKPQGRPAGRFGKLAPYTGFFSMSSVRNRTSRSKSWHPLWRRPTACRFNCHRCTGAMNGPAFGTYIETQLAPALQPGTVVILDNLSTHKSPRAADALTKRGCWFLFLPAYSPDLNPIEMTFSKLKTHRRRIGLGVPVLANLIYIQLT